MLFEVESKGNADIISFFPNGKAFAVHKVRVTYRILKISNQPELFLDDLQIPLFILSFHSQPREFVSTIMPKYFSTARISSFQRQLNLYGFHRIEEGREKGGYQHEFFRKGQRSLCNKIRRNKIKGGGLKRDISDSSTQSPGGPLGQRFPTSATEATATSRAHTTAEDDAKPAAQATQGTRSTTRGSGQTPNIGRQTSSTTRGSTQ